MAFILKSLFSKTEKLVNHTQYSGELQNEVYIQGCLGQIPLILCQILQILQILSHSDSCKERRCTSHLMTKFQLLLFCYYQRQLWQDTKLAKMNNKIYINSETKSLSIKSLVSCQITLFSYKSKDICHFSIEESLYLHICSWNGTV